MDAYLKRALNMIFPLIPIPFGRIQLYQKPISMRFGERKLTQLCCQELGREPKTNELMLPAPKDGEVFVTLARSKLDSVFRTGRK